MPYLAVVISEYADRLYVAGKLGTTRLTQDPAQAIMYPDRESALDAATDASYETESIDAVYVEEYPSHG